MTKVYVLSLVRIKIYRHRVDKNKNLNIYYTAKYKPKHPQNVDNSFLIIFQYSQRNVSIDPSFSNGVSKC